MISETLAIVLALSFFLVLLMTQVPVAFSLLVAGAAGLFLLDGWRPAEGVLRALPFTTTAAYSLVLIPMFVFMGVVVSETGIAEEIFNTSNRLVGRLPGGLALSTLVACAFFGGISGSSAADVATIGRISMREMRRYGYERYFAASVVAAGGTVAILIPPSIVLVIYGILTQESIGQLLIAGIVPGTLTLLAYMGVVLLQVRRKRAYLSAAGKDAPEPHGALAGIATVVAGRQEAAVLSGEPRSPATAPFISDSTGGAIPASPPEREPVAGGLGGALYAASLFVIVIGGIYIGFFTPTEAGSVGALAALLLGALSLARKRRRDIAIPTLVARALRETVSVSSMIFAILVGGSIFTQFLLAARLPQEVTRSVTSLDLPPILIVALIIAMLIPLGMLLDGLSMLLITVPLAYPIVVTELGYSGIWFGVLMVVAIELGLITPPVGLNVYVIAGIDKTLRAERIFVGVLPFVGALTVLMTLFLIFPEIVTWLPDLTQAQP